MSESKAKAKPRRKKRQYTQNPVVIDKGIPCPHCGYKYEHEKIRPMEGYPNGSRRMRCGGVSKTGKGCGKPFISRTEQ